MGIAVRYASALFDLAKSAGNIADVEKDIDALAVALEGSPEFLDLMTSPIYSREQQADAIAAIAVAMGLSEMVSNTLQLKAQKRRLFVLPYMIEAMRALIAEEKGEVTAEVTSAKKLTKAQETKLAAALKKSVGKDVKINSTVDAGIIGGLVVKVGSKMIDSSIASKLSNLQNAMKEVG